MKKSDRSIFLLFVLLTVLAISGCAPAAPSEPVTAIPTTIPKESPTTSPTAIPTIMPLPSPTLIPVTYVYGDEVSAAERKEFELGMRSTYAYLAEQHLGSPGPQTVIALYDPEQMTEISYPLYGPEFHSTKDQVRSIWRGAAGINASNVVPPLPISPPAGQPRPTNTIILPIAIPTGGGPDPLAAIFVLTSIPKEFYNYPCYKVEYVAHDIWHTMQRKWTKLPLRSGYPMPKTGPEWLKEGSAQYFSFKVAAVAHPDQCDFAKEFATKTADFFSVPLKLSSMESSASLGTAQQEVFTLGAFAVDYLVGKSPKGIGSLKGFYEAIGRGLSPDEAFQEAFGQSSDAFYAEFQDYQQQQFNASLIPPPRSGEGTVRIEGKVILKDDSQNFGQYYINYCKIRIDDESLYPDKCSGLPINGDGRFYIDIAPGKYYISVNPTDDDDARGWYSKDGLVTNPSCATIITVDNDQSIIITIDPKNIRAC